MTKDKTDRRTAYTKELIKSTLLGLMEKKEFIKIPVTDLCKTAEINRGTFYLHYSDIYEALDEVITDMMSETTSLIDHVMCNTNSQRGFACPFCVKIHEDTKYQVLFLDESISSIIVNNIAKIGKKDFVMWIMKRSLLTFEQAEAIYYFQINGCLSINRQALKNKSTNWKTIQSTIDIFIKSGLENFLIDD